MSISSEHHRDQEYLRILLIGFYVVAATEALGGCIMMGFALLGVAMMAGAVENMPPEAAFFLGLFFTVAWAATAFIFWAWCFLEILVARSLASHQRYRLCFAWACIELINLPFGTLVGVFAIVILSRPGVHALFTGVPQRDPRLAAFDELEEDDEAAPLPRSTGAKGDASIREGGPTT